MTPCDCRRPFVPVRSNAMGKSNIAQLVFGIFVVGSVASCSDFQQGFIQGYENATMGDGAHWVVQDKIVDPIDDRVVQRANLIGRSMELQVVCLDGTIGVGAILPNGDNPDFDSFFGDVLYVDARFDDNQAEQVELLIEREDAATFPISFVERIFNHQSLTIRVPLVRGEAVTEIFNLEGTSSMLERMSCATDGPIDSYEESFKSSFEESFEESFLTSCTARALESLGATDRSDSDVADQVRQYCRAALEGIKR